MKPQWRNISTAIDYIFFGLFSDITSKGHVKHNLKITKMIENLLLQRSWNPKKNYSLADRRPLHTTGGEPKRNQSNK